MEFGKSGADEVTMGIFKSDSGRRFSEAIPMTNIYTERIARSMIITRFYHHTRIMLK